MALPVITDEVKQAHEQIRAKALRFMTLKLSDDYGSVVIEYSGSSGATYMDFLKTLPHNQCRWGLFDLECEQKDGGTRSELMMLCWSPDESPIRQKMYYASRKDSIRKVMAGIRWEVGATDLTEIDLETILDKVERR